MFHQSFSSGKSGNMNLTITATTDTDCLTTILHKCESINLKSDQIARTRFQESKVVSYYPMAVRSKANILQTDRVSIKPL